MYIYISFKTIILILSIILLIALIYYTICISKKLLHITKKISSIVDENEGEIKLTIKDFSQLFDKISTILNYSSHIKEFLLLFKDAKK